MATAIDAGLVKFHASLNVSDLPRSIAFYRVLLGTGPAKVRDDYAKFDLAEPPLVLSLIPGRPAQAAGNLNHVGLRVRTAEELVEIQRRLEVAGMRTEREEGVECCYARQTKFWIADPDNALWEIYVFHEDIHDHGSDAPLKVAPASAASTAPASAAAPATWTHRLTDPMPDRLPFADASLDDVRLEGSINVAPETPHRAGLLAEIRRVLRPGATLNVHGLAGDRPSASRPSLPGPAAVVQHVPSTAEVVNDLAHAGFVEIQIETLSTAPPFVVAGLPMREIRVVARTPSWASPAAKHRAVYLGPMAQVTDDFGNLFTRGVITALPARDWEMLSTGPARKAFLFLGPEVVDLAAAGCCGAPAATVTPVTLTTRA
jgi:catechol 2,3-dioxygenase-like lactoylglutathione lyase family enzyme